MKIKQSEYRYLGGLVRTDLYKTDSNSANYRFKVRLFEKLKNKIIEKEEIKKHNKKQKEKQILMDRICELANEINRLKEFTGLDQWT